MVTRTSRTDRRAGRVFKRCKCGTSLIGWAVVLRNKHLNKKGEETFSPRSLVRCQRCGDEWKTAADYVDKLPDMKEVV